MAANRLKSDIRRLLIKNALILAVVIAFAAGSYTYYTHNSDKLEETKRKINDTRIQITRKESEYQESVKQFDEFKMLDMNKIMPQNGYESGRDRLSIILSVVRELKDNYHFSSLNLSLSEIKPMEGYSASTFQVFSNKITIDFAGVSDEYLYSFINDLKFKLPGFISIDQLSIVKNKEITEDKIKDALNSGKIDFVSGNINLTWVTLKSNKTDAGAKN